MALSSSLYKCQNCSFYCERWRTYVNHSFEAHSSELNFSFTCRIEGCPRSFSRYSSFKSHLSRKHPNPHPPPPVPTPEQSAGDILDDHQDPYHADQSATSSSTNSMDTTQEDESLSSISDADVQKSVALLLLKAKEKHRLTQVSIDFIVEQMKIIVSQLLKHIEVKVQDSLSEGCDLSTTLSECFASITNPFDKLDTEHMQSKYYRENFNLVVRLFSYS